MCDISRVRGLLGKAMGTASLFEFVQFSFFCQAAFDRFSNPAGRIHEGRQGAKGFENLSVWFGPEAGVLVVWPVERLWPCQVGQGQRGFRLPEVSFGHSSAVRLLKLHLNGSEGMARMAKELG